MTEKIVLTGIKPTGDLHIGNYVGAIRPAISLIQEPGILPRYFIADYHALTSMQNREELHDRIYQIAAAWLAFGLDPEKVLFYRQSDVPEIFELSWILSCLTSKGLLNRAHAYKAKVDDNLANDRDPDNGVNMGLYNYPVLMAADILMFNTHLVPVGKDQIQHVEIARDIAEHFNKTYGDTFTLPEALVEETTAVIPGLDGRKMSKSYGNVIPLFTDEKKLRKAIFRIKTDSKTPEEPKDPKDSTLFDIYRAFATEAEIADLAKRYEEGIGYGEIKQILFDQVNEKLKEPRKIYTELINDKAQLDTLLKKGGEQAREYAHRFMLEIRNKIGRY
ncbi:tryptophanyl-tRNA synthetase [Pullulanibacillus pueri]|uniref:Tryptophan--tRNA ligase n=1 Tax=Pullulanibacillus pueri TaxID=1437324 RepID=A0A8J3ELX8_9BACL|nr:tryptophan--tRNA ligase [Pullulanibacillus pueri]MBM7682293.1 tryptophanyl-tRNA synthetase [Pullulanibacillus pueri]GGH80914.1 tryptophanyl-tRNA synthetase [Pullulanibacillus pueri]